MIATTKELLYVFQISRETLRRWTEKGLGKIEKGRFDLQKVIEWRGKNILQFGQDEMAKARLRREQARARREELETQEKEGQLVTRDAAIQWLLMVTMAARAGFLGLDRRVCPDNKEMQGKIREEVHRIFRILYEARKDAERMIKNKTFLNHKRR